MMNMNHTELFWRDHSLQEIPDPPEYDSLILEGGTIEPEFWKPENPAENHDEIQKERRCPEWLLRFVPGDLLIAIPETGLTIGSSALNDLILDDPTISRFHALLAPSSSGWLLKDAGSLNGTFFNGEPVRQEVLLKPEDEFLLARNRRFRIERVQSDE